MPRTAEDRMGTPLRTHDLDHRLQARALALALRPDVSADLAADSLVVMAGATPAAPIAVRRARDRLESANGVCPNALTGKAVEALTLALERVDTEREPRRLPGAR